MVETNSPVDVDHYLRRIAYTGPTTTDLATLEGLQRAHMTAAAFENLDVFHHKPVTTELSRSLAKVVEGGRGGWCFELNGAFAALLEALGFRVARLGAAVLLAGPNKTVDHLTLEVQLDQPYLVDVGFGDSFIRPLALNDRSIQDGGAGRFQFIDSPEGLTMAVIDDDDLPVPQYRFRRVNLELSDFDAASERLQNDRTLHWSQKPFATRLLDGGPDRVTLLSDRLKIQRSGSVEETPVAPAEWNATLAEWFHMDSPESENPRPTTKESPIK